MLLTVNGPRNPRELAELVKTLMDWCADGGHGDVDAVLEQVAKRYLVTVTEAQRYQVYTALAEALPADTGEGEDPVEDVTAWVASRLRYEPHVLYALMMTAWMDLCSQAEAEATRENEERERTQRDPVAEAIRQLTLTGRYYVVAHNGRGKPLLSDAVIGLGLASAVLAELVIAGRIDLETRTHKLLRLPPAAAPAPPEAPEGAPNPAPAVCRAAEGTLEQLSPTTPTPLRDHLGALAAAIEERVRTDLAEMGIVSPETRGMLRERVYYAPAHRGLAKAIRAMVGGALYTDPIAPADAMLAELAIATGLDAKQISGWDRLASMSRGNALAKSNSGPSDASALRTAQLRLLVDLTSAEVDAVVTSPGT